MFRTKFPMLMTLTATICCPSSSFTCAQEPPAKKAVSDKDYLLKQDPFIVKAIRSNSADTPLKKLQKERCSEALIALAKHQEKIKNGGWDSSSFTLFQELAESLSSNLQEAMDNEEDRIKGYEFVAKALKEFEEFTAERVRNGTETTQRFHIAKAARLDIEIELLKLKAQVEKPKK